MKKLPVIVGFGGINAAGRTSFHHAYRRMVHEALPEDTLSPMFDGLAKLMNLEDASDREKMLNGTLVRKIEERAFDTKTVKIQRKTTMLAKDKPIEFQTKRRQLPQNIPDNWTVEDIGTGLVNVTVEGDMEVLTHDTYTPGVTSAAQLPSGFDASAMYNSRNQPNGLQYAVFGASDAINSMGISWETILESINPDEISVYAGSANRTTG